MKRIVTALGCAMALTLVTAAAQTDTWREYVYSDDGFAMSAPTEPTLTTQPIYVVGGTADAHIYTIAAGPDTALMLFIFERHRKDRRSASQLRQQARQWALDWSTASCESRRMWSWENSVAPSSSSTHKILN